MAAICVCCCIHLQVINHDTARDAANHGNTVGEEGVSPAFPATPPSAPGSLPATGVSLPIIPSLHFTCPKRNTPGAVMTIIQFGSRNVFDECVCTELALLSEIPNCEREREKEKERVFRGLLSSPLRRKFHGLDTQEYHSKDRPRRCRYES